MTSPLTEAPVQTVRFHLSLNVNDLRRAVAFYRTLFGCEPAKLQPDYAKFELEEPALVLSLEPTPRAIGGPLNHLGFRMPDVARLVAMQERLARAGIETQREEGVECCYARQTKFWVYDPDRTLWEVYTFDGDIEHRGAGQLPEKVLPPETVPPSGVTASLPLQETITWMHYLGQEIPARASFEDDSVDEVLFRGNLNVPVTEEQQRHLFAEAYRVLRPGGRLFVHVLTAEQPFTGSPDLPGPAAAVQHVPLTTEVVARVEEAHFQGVKLLKLAAKPCFVRQGIAMRETQIEAWKPTETSGATVQVIYKGPFQELKDDQGNTYKRGQAVAIDASAASRLRAPEWADQFTILG